MGQTAKVLIEGYTKKGHGLGSFAFSESNKKVKVEVAHALKGDEVLVELRRQKKGWCKGKLLELLSPSSHRVKAPCAHTSICGGCTWQELDYSEQLRSKEQIVHEIFSPLIDSQELMQPIIAAENLFAYRNKMEFSFSQNKALTRYLGLMIAAVGNYVFNVEHCHIAPSWMSAVLLSVRKWWESSDITAYNLYDDSGTLRTLTLRDGRRSGEKMVVLTISGRPDFALSETAICNFLQAVTNSISADNLTVVLREQRIAKGVPTTFYERILLGKGFILEKLLLDNERGLYFKLSPASFFQPNPLQAEKLYQAALHIFSLSGNETLFDLYCGAGSLGMVFAPFVKEVVGIELIADAVEDAKENMRLNNIHNFKIYAGDVGKTLATLRENPNFTTPDIVVVDPPRAGLDILSLSQINNLQPKKIIYVSCNPATQGENVGALLSLGYKIVKIQPVDQFPHTPHVENIVALVKK